MDAGVSGGIWGLENGYGLMVGGSKDDVERVMPIFDALRPEGPRDEGFVHVGEVGAGHYAKMVHNGIEYALMQAYAEGYELLDTRKDIIKDVTGTFKAWQRGTVVRSWLLELLVRRSRKTRSSSTSKAMSQDSGEGRWTVEEALTNAVPVPTISASIFARFVSRQEDSPAMKAVAALRNQFGGHAVQGRGLADSLRVVTHLSLTDFRNYRHAEVALAAGANLFVGSNGQGKTNLVESLGYLSTLGSHRVSSDQAMIRQGRSQRSCGPASSTTGASCSSRCRSTAERPIAHRSIARRSRPRELPRYFSSVLFAPEDLALVRGEPSIRRVGSSISCSSSAIRDCPVCWPITSAC